MARYTFGEFFSGPGGMSCGALAAAKSLGEGFQMVPTFAVDYDPDACQTYLHNIHEGKGQVFKEGGGTSVPGIDVAQVDGESIVVNADVRNVQAEKLSGVDIFMFGFPCNDFSNAGERKGLGGDFGLLYKEGLKYLTEKNPKVFIAENVSGLLHANNYGAFTQILTELQCPDLASENKNYVITPHLYKFEEYGVPQTRHRILIVGIRADVNDALTQPFEPPAPTHLGNYVTAEMAFEPVNYPRPLPNNMIPRINDTVFKRLQVMKHGQNIWDINDTLPQELRLKATGACISSIYKKLDPTKPAYTVVGSGGGGTHMYHWENRRTTDRERAQLQTFPLDYYFVGGPQSTRKQIGMAVPPHGAMVIIESVLKALNGIQYDRVRPNLLEQMDPEFVEKKRAKKVRQQEAALERKAAKEADAIALQGQTVNLIANFVDAAE